MDINKELSEIALNNPIVYAYLISYNKGFLTKDECLIKTIKHLALANKDLVYKCIELQGTKTIYIYKEGIYG